jgi:hypothetical protein
VRDNVGVDFVQLATTLGGDIVGLERGKVREPQSFSIRRGDRPEIHAYPELSEGECVGVHFAVDRPGTRDMPRIVLRREGALDRGGKALGINREIQLGDDSFDAAVYIETEAPDAFVRAVLAAPEARSAALDLVRGPAGGLHLDDGRLVIHLGAAQLADPRPDELHATLERLLALQRSLAVPKDIPSRADIVRRRSVGHIAGLAALWLVAVLVAVFVRPPPVLAWGPIFAALGLGVGLWLLVLVVVGLIRRGAADSLRWLLICAVAYLLAVPFAGMKLALLANAALDRGPEQVERKAVTVVDASDSLVLLDIDALVPDEPSTRLSVRRTMAPGTWSTGRRSATLVIRPGALGWPWLAEARP